MDQQAAVIADGLLIARRPRVDEGHRELDAASDLFHWRINHGSIFLDRRAEARQSGRGRGSSE
mgnify:CR=1 FL=1